MAEFLQQCGSWGVLATLAAYAAGVWVNRKTGKALFNPLLMGSIFVIVFLSCFGVPYADYKSSAQPVSWLLMPATVSLAIPLYEKWELLEKNLAAIFASIAAGVLTSLGSVLAMAWVLKLERAHAVSFLPKSVTTAIGMDVAETLGGTAATVSECADLGDGKVQLTVQKPEGFAGGQVVVEVQEKGKTAKHRADLGQHTETLYYDQTNLPVPEELAEWGSWQLVGFNGDIYCLPRASTPSAEVIAY